MPGQAYRNKHTGKIGVLVAVNQRHHAWIILRSNNREQEYPLRWLDEHWEPCRPNGESL